MWPRSVHCVHTTALSHRWRDHLLSWQPAIVSQCFVFFVFLSFSVSRHWFVCDCNIKTDLHRMTETFFLKWAKSLCSSLILSSWLRSLSLSISLSRSPRHKHKHKHCHRAHRQTHRLVFASTNDWLQIQRESESQSQVVTGETFRTNFEHTN